MDAPAATLVNEPRVAPPTRLCSLTMFLLFATKFLRMFSYGCLAPIFWSYLLALRLGPVKAGFLLTAVLLGDLAITLNLTTRADSFGRRNVLIVGAMLKLLAGLVFAATSNFWILLCAGIVGVISTSGGEIGPFVSVEQASLTDSAILVIGEQAAKQRIPVIFGWYNAVGYLAQALGALTAGNVIAFLETRYQYSQLEGMRVILVSYATIGMLMALMYGGLGREVESPHLEIQQHVPWSLALLLPKMDLGLKKQESVFVVFRLSALFALDAFAGGFTMQTWIALWFSKRWNFDTAFLGDLISVANVVAGISGISAAYFVNRFGAINTMVWTHLPSNVLLILVPVMMTREAAAAVLIARFCISQMDVPARQSYVAMVVASNERSAAGGITNIARSIGMLIAPAITGFLTTAPPGSSMFDAPYYISGGLKIIYDLTLWFLYNYFSGMRAAEKQNSEPVKVTVRPNDEEVPLIEVPKRGYQS